MIAFNFQPMDGSEDIKIQDFVQNKGDLVAGTTDTIPAGKGFWHARPSEKAAGTLIEKSPLAPATAE